jgi:hypothetical protein
MAAIGVVANVVALVYCIAALLQGTPMALLIGACAVLNVLMMVIGLRNFRDLN